MTGFAMLDLEVLSQESSGQRKENEGAANHRHAVCSRRLHGALRTMTSERHA